MALDLKPDDKAKIVMIECIIFSKGQTLPEQITHCIGELEENEVDSV